LLRFLRRGDHHRAYASHATAKVHRRPGGPVLTMWLVLLDDARRRVGTRSLTRLVDSRAAQTRFDACTRSSTHFAKNDPRRTIAEHGCANRGETSPPFRTRQRRLEDGFDISLHDACSRHGVAAEGRVLPDAPLEIRRGTPTSGLTGMLTSQIESFWDLCKFPAKRELYDEDDVRRVEVAEEPRRAKRESPDNAVERR
jgi:hypothetical protein